MLVTRPDFFNPFVDASEIQVLGRSHGRIARAPGYASHGEPAGLVRDRRGTIVEVRLGGARFRASAASPGKCVRGMPPRAPFAHAVTTATKPIGKREYPDGMDIRDGFVGAIGNTPLIRLRGPSERTGCEILGKAEFLNPGGSVKDRAALYIILDAEKRGLLGPGGTIVEGTAGNTGIGLALVGNARGYRTVIVIPETQSQEKKDMLRLCGAELREVPAVPYKDPNNYVHVSERVAKELDAFWANQWDNTANRDGHNLSTGPEIWAQTDGKVDGFTCAIGTGGTLAGVSRLSETEKHEHQDRRRRPARGGDVLLVQARRAQVRGLLDHRGHRPGPRDEEHRGRAGRRRLPDPGQRSAARSCSTC